MVVNELMVFIFRIPPSKWEHKLLVVVVGASVSLLKIFLKFLQIGMVMKFFPVYQTVDEFLLGADIEILIAPLSSQKVGGSQIRGKLNQIRRKI
jgi:hypothetical protein